MRIGVVSDTHGHLDFTRDAVRMLESFAPTAVLHCGDIGSPEVIRLFDAWPTHFVMGNVDYDEPGLRAACDAAGHTFHGRFGELELEGVRIALLHGDDARRLDEASQTGRYDLVCSGHTHVARTERQGSTLLLNPGAVYRADPHSIAVVDLPALEAHVVRI